MKKMRKSLVLILVFVLVLTLFVACNRGGDQGGNANNDQSQGDQGDGEQGGNGEQGGGGQGGGEQVSYFDYNLSEIFAKYAEADDWNFKAQYDAYVDSMNTPNYSYTFGFMGALTMSVGHVEDGHAYQDYYVYGDAYYLDNLDGTHTKYKEGSDGYNENAGDVEDELFYIDELGKYAFEHFDLASTEGMSGKFNQYVAKDPVEAGNGIFGGFAEDPDYDMYWKRIEVYLQGENICKLVAIAQCDYLNVEGELESCDYKYEVTFSDFGQVNFDLGDLTIKTDTSGGDTPIESKTYTAVFTDNNLTNNSGIDFSSTVKAENAVDEYRGLQFLQTKGEVVISTDSTLTNVTSITLVVATNNKNKGMYVSVAVGNTAFSVDGNTKINVTKTEYNVTNTLVFTVANGTDGKLSITLTPTQSGKDSTSMYIKSVEVVCGGTTGGGGTTPTPTEVMPAQNFNAATLDKSTLREKLIEYYGNDDLLPLESKGAYHCLVVPVQFSDYAVTNTQLDNLNKAFNGSTTDTGWQSVKTYYQTSSYGNLDMTFDIQSVYTAKNDSSYYETTTKSVTCEGESVDLAGDAIILEEVMAWITPQIDLSVYDHDNNGILDAIWIIYTAPVVYDSSDDASSSLDDESICWAYVTSYAKDDSDNTKYDNLDLGYYLFAGFDFMNEYTGNANDPYNDTTGQYVNATISGLKINASTYIHETGHLLGLDDYYDYYQNQGSDNGLGGADMMDYTVGDHNAYSKMMLGWVNPTVVTTTQTVTLNPFESSGSCIMVLLDYNGSYFSEYLLIDLYTNTGLNTAHANQANSYLYYDYDTEKGASYGVRIYHVSSKIAENPYTDEYGSFTECNNSVTEFPLIKLVQADGEKDFSADEYGLCSADDLWKAGQKLSTVFPNYARNDNKKVNFDIEIVSVSATSATVTITFAA